MLSVSNKLIPGLFLCLFSLQAGAQNAPVQSQTAKLASSSFDFAKITETTQKPWQTSKYFNTDRQAALKEFKTSIETKLRSAQMLSLDGGSHGGGGGSALICTQENGEIKTMLLDLHELVKGGDEIDLGPGNFEQKLQYAFTRLAKVAPIHAAHYAAIARDLLTKNTNWLVNTDLVTVRDTKLLSLPRNCNLAQVAVQHPVEKRNIPKLKVFEIDKDLFTLLDEDSKAALIIHEAIYRTARYSNHTDSLFIRSLTGIISSKLILQEDKYSFSKMLMDNSIYCIEHTYLPALVLSDNNDSKNLRACDYVYDSPAVHKTNQIKELQIGRTIFDSLEGSIHEITSVYSETKINELKGKIGDLLSSFSFNQNESFGQITNRFIPDTNISNMDFFVLNGSLTTSMKENISLRMTIKNSTVGFSDDGTYKFVLGSTQINYKNFVLHAVSGDLNLPLNNYMTKWNNQYCLDAQKNSSNPCKEEGLKIDLFAISEFDERNAHPKIRNAPEKGFGYMKVKIPSDWAIEGRDKQGWVDVYEVVFDSKGNVLKATTRVLLDNNKAKFVTFNLKTREVTETGPY